MFHCNFGVKIRVFPVFFPGVVFYDSCFGLSAIFEAFRGENGFLLLAFQANPLCLSALYTHV